MLQVGGCRDAPAAAAAAAGSGETTCLSAASRLVEAAALPEAITAIAWTGTPVAAVAAAAAAVAAAASAAVLLLAAAAAAACGPLGTTAL